MRRSRAIVLAALATACGGTTTTLPPRGQVLLFIDTDAPLPDLSSKAGVLAPLPLFDHLRIDVYACADEARCKPITRDFAVDSALLRSPDGLSFGVAAGAPGDTPLVRARLFLGTVTEGEEPPPDVTIDVTAMMPPVAAEGIVEATLFLPTDHVGDPTSDLANPVATTTGRPSPTAVGTWPLARRVDCDVTPSDGEVCVPGGAFWMGSALLKGFRVWQDPASDARRLVALSPFYVDAHEVTVAEYRASKLSVAFPWSGSTDGTTKTDWCTFTRTPGPHEDRPINCVTRATAQAFCRSSGKEFPTEAQFEYLAGNLAGQLWPWGADPASCTDAVVGRAYGSIDPTDPFPSSACRGKAAVDGPQDVGAIPRDAVDVPGEHGGKVFDLVGNVSEYMRDVWQFRSDECWARRGLYVDPFCGELGTTLPAATVLKGGNYWWVPALSFAQMRFPAAVGYEADPLFGFRCVRSAVARKLPASGVH